MPSRVEGFGLVGSEALSAGIPALVSDRSGLAQLMREVLPRECANRLIVPVRGDGGDTALWGHRIAAVMLDRGAAFANAAEARERMVAARTWAAAARALLAFIHECHWITTVRA